MKKRVRDSGGCLPWILMLAAMVFLLLAVWEYAPFLANDLKMEQLQKQVVREPMEEESEQKADVPKWADKKIDWEKLHKTNPDIIAWITVPGTKIDYPVLHCKKWNEYLHKDYKGDQCLPGSIFIQPETSEDLSDFHTILYGHNMRNQSMFGSLHRFEARSFWKKHRKIYIYQPGQAICASIYSSYDCPDKTDTYLTEWKEEAGKEEWIRMTISNSYFDSGIRPTAADRIITLSTCSNSGPRSSRYVIHSLKKEVYQYHE